MKKPPVRKQLFLVFFLALFLLVARLFYPFLTILLWSGLLYAFLDPIYTRLTGRLATGQKRTIASSVVAGIMALLGVTIIVVPVVFLGIALVRQLVDTTGEALRYVESNPGILDLSPGSAVGGFLNRLSGGAIDLSNVNIVNEVKHFLANSTRSIIGYSGALVKNILTLGITLAFMVFTLYFFLVDGKHLVMVLIGSIPIERRYTTMFLRKLRDTSRQLVKGFFLVALYQSVAMFLICLVFGIDKSLVVAALTAVASFIPMAGTALVWGPLTLLLALSGPLWKAIAFMVTSAILVSSVDNFLRPMLLGERLRIHPLIIFFAILGGLNVFGFNGLILGPLILITFFAAVDLYDKLDGIGKAGAGPGSGADGDASVEAGGARGGSPGKAGGGDASGEGDGARGGGPGKAGGGAAGGPPP